MQLKSGFAELYGTELVKTIKNKCLQGAKDAVLLYQGCVLLSIDGPTVSYIARETPMLCHQLLSMLMR